jgi:peptidoglycan/xylan/chitin deacetylase (PgdA/CDA1 family)
MDTLVRLAKAIPADGMTPLSSGERYAAVTFDDAYQSVLQNAVPELVVRKIPATIFVIAGIIGRSPGWEGYLENTMTLAELKELPADLITLGSHTITHPALPSISEVQAKSELADSRTKLEALLGRKIELFSFPYGAFEEKMIRWCKEAGYERVFTTLPYWAFGDGNEFVTGRVSVEPDDWSIEFYLKLYGAYRWLPWAFSVKRMLTLERSSGN